MNTFNAARRDLLKLSTAGLAGLAMPAMADNFRPTVSGEQGRSNVFDVRLHGASGDGQSVDSPAIQKAIDAAERAGGGVVLFTPGDYISFSLHLKSNVELHLMLGARLIAADSPLPGKDKGYRGGTYDLAEPNTSYDAYQDYGHNHWHNSLIWAEDAHHMAITGRGLIWGRGLSHGRNRMMIDIPFIAEQSGVGNKAIAMKNCRNVQLRDFSILKGGHFGLLLTGVDNLIIDGLTIDTDRDGMDIDCCRNVRVSNCAVNAPWDDAICPKSSFALGYARSTDNVTISNCFVSGYYKLGTLLDGTFQKFAVDDKTIPRTGRIKCGTESNGGFRNITITNCIFEGCNGFALESEDGAIVEDIAISNCTMRDLHSGPFFFRLGARLRGPKESTQVGVMRRILVSNVTCSNAESRLASIISGIPGHNIEDMKFTNVYVQHKGGAAAEQAAIVPPEKEDAYPDPPMFGPMPAHGFFFRHVRNLELSHVEVQPMAADARPAFVLTDVERADFFAVTAPTAVPNFDLRGVRDLRIAWSRAAKDTVIAEAASQHV